VNPVVPQVRLFGSHNHPPETKDIGNIYKNIVMVQKFVRSTDGRLTFQTVEIKQENP
jgi:hypothetical protein